MEAANLTQEYVRSILKYENGTLYWRVKKSSNTKLDKPITSKESGGYIQVRIDGIAYLAHRIIFLYHNGYLPFFIDHKNGNRQDNRIENLREASKNENAMNRETKNKSFKNVYFHKPTKKYQVSLRINGKNKSFGYFPDLETAVKVAKDARNKHHKEFANHGRAPE